MRFHRPEVERADANAKTGISIAGEHVARRQARRQGRDAEDNLSQRVAGRDAEGGRSQRGCRKGAERAPIASSCIRIHHGLPGTHEDPS